MKTKHDILKTRGHAAGPSSLVDAAGRSGFTLLEMLVAVGAVAVISVGLAAVFDAVGKTVSGGKRTSVVNTYSTLLDKYAGQNGEATFGVPAAYSDFTLPYAAQMVPEPATWGFMLSGLGLVGVVLRRRA